MHNIHCSKYLKVCHIFSIDDNATHGYLRAMSFQLHSPSMLPAKAKFVVCSKISHALSFWMKHLVIGQLQKPAKFSAFHWSTSRSQALLVSFWEPAG